MVLKSSVSILKRIEHCARNLGIQIFFLGIQIYKNLLYLNSDCPLISSNRDLIK